MLTASFSNIYSGPKTGFIKHVFFQRLLLQVCNGVGPVLHCDSLPTSTHHHPLLQPPQRLPKYSGMNVNFEKTTVLSAENGDATMYF